MTKNWLLDPQLQVRKPESLGIKVRFWTLQFDEVVSRAVDYELSRFCYDSATEDFEGFLKLIAATGDIYGHLLPGWQKEAADASPDW